MIKSDGALFEVRDVDIAYGDRKVLHGVSADIQGRDVTAILGPSGCGKSTLLRALNRTLELTPRARLARGTIRFRGEDLMHHRLGPHQIRKRIGIVQQRPLPFPMSIRENVLFGVRYHERCGARRASELTEHYLTRVGLWDEVKDRLAASATALSIGQQQRLCIARSLANRPEVLLMDEPCSALDPASTAKIEELILGLRAEIAIVIVTHNLAQARRVASWCLFFLAGTLAEQGRSDDVLGNPAHAGVRAIVSGQEG